MSEPHDQTVQVMAQADALMRRHRVFVAGGATVPPHEPEATANEDIPVLTDIVPLGAGSGLVTADPLDQLIGRQEQAAREAVEQWLDEHLPAEILRIADELSDHMIDRLQQRVRTELLPAILESLATARKPEEPDRGV
jgi:hypothetical protein